MLNTLTMVEYVDWIAYFSMDNVSRSAEQTPEQMQANLMLVKAATKKTKKAKKK